MKNQSRLWNVPLLSVALVSTLHAAATAAAPPKTLLSSFTHPISKEPRLSDGPAAETSFGRGRGGEPFLPVSKAVESGKSALYSRNVNRVLCEATDKTAQRTWLGCLLGVKLVDRKAGTVRHFGPADGLPDGQAIEICTDASGDAWCIVRGAPQTVTVPASATVPASLTFIVSRPRPGQEIPLYLCAFSSATNRWQTLRTVRLSAGYTLNSRSGYDDYSPNGSGRNLPFVAQSGRPRILVGADTVTFSLGAAAASETVALYQWSRKNKSVETIAWEAGVRADNPALVTTFLGSDAKNGFWIGTNAGLMHYAKTAAGGPSWSRTLSDQVIGEGVSAVGGAGVWVTATPRKPPTESYNSYAQKIPWSLYRVAGAGTAQAADRTPVAKTAPDTAPASPSGRRFPFDRFVPNAGFPAAVSLDTDGALWLTQKGNTGSGANIALMQGQGGTLDSWWRLDPKGSDWTRYEMHASSSPSMGFNATPFLRKTTASGEVYDNVSLSLLPEGAILPLTFYTAPRDNNTYYTLSGGILIRDAQEDYGASFWIRRRFPAWICADDIGDAFGDRDGFSLDRRRETPRMGPIDDPAGPAGPAGRVWVMDLKGTTLLHLPKTAMPASLREAREKGFTQNSPEPDLAMENNPTIERYPFPAGKTIQTRPNVNFMVAGKGKSSSLLFVASNQKLIAFDTDSQQFTAIPFPDQGIYPSQFNPPVVTNEGAIILSSPNSSVSQAVRLDPADGSTRVLTALEPGNRVFGVTPNGGLWITTQNGKISYKEPGADTPTLLPDAIQNTQSGNAPRPVATGAIAWTSLDGKSLVGYDIERKRLTPPITLRNQNGSGDAVPKLIDDDSGGAYVASEAGVSHYDRERNVWEAIAPLPPLPAADPSDRNYSSTSPRTRPLVLVSGDKTALWLLADARWLMRFDRTKQAWDEPIALPPSFRRSRSSDDTVSVLPAENGTAFYVGDQRGLWRYGVGDRTWTEKRQTIPIPASGSAVSDMRERLIMSSLFVTVDSVFTLSSYANGSAYFATRLDRRTKEWSVYDETRGFPARSAGMRLAAGGGGSVWLLHSDGTYLFDAKRDLWRLAFGPAETGLAPSGEPIPAVALDEGKKASAPDGIPNYSIVDLVADPKSGDSILLATYQDTAQSGRSVVLRCDPTGRILARSEPPREGPYVRGSSLLYDNGAALIATTTGVYRAFGPGPGGGTVWQSVPAPPGLELPGGVTLLRRGPSNKGLYVMNTDSVAFWAGY